VEEGITEEDSSRVDLLVSVLVGLNPKSR
jgi:hypothetical protein